MLAQEGFLRLNTVRGQNKENKNYSLTVCYLWLNSPNFKARNKYGYGR